MAINSYEPNFNRELLFYHRDNDDGKNEHTTNIAKEMYTKINNLSSKLAQVPVVLIDKRTDKKKYQNNKPFRKNSTVKNSPSFLLQLMKSITKSKHKSLNYKLENVSPVMSTSNESLKKNPRYSINFKSLGSNSSNVNSDQSNIKISVKRQFSNRDYPVNKKEINSIKTGHFFRSNEKLFNQNLDQFYLKKFVDSQSNPYVYKNVFDDYLNNKSQINESKNETKSFKSDQVDDSSTEYIEFLFNSSKNILFLLILLLIVWPAIILFKLFWFVTKYSSCMFPNLEDFSEFFEKWHMNFIELDDKILDQITFLN
ncbi:unnamed protein product [Brachionus calyciflorus]|uniref:Uncharacterized protein n=1 Tax=Brachionus calyciflorus TaxID=104777 RepID=A0A813NM11_9BILA|nr:unnamed protein product [Brachionus calyciflorus]